MAVKGSINSKTQRNGILLLFVVLELGIDLRVTAFREPELRGYPLQDSQFPVDLADCCLNLVKFPLSAFCFANYRNRLMFLGINLHP